MKSLHVRVAKATDRVSRWSDSPTGFGKVQPYDPERWQCVIDS